MGIMKKIVIIPGWTYSVDRWANLSGELKKSGFNIEILKVPGLTQSSNEVWDLKKYAQWLKGELESEHEVTLVGHSNGGRIAIAYAIENPRKLSGLVLINSAGIFHNEPLLRLKRFVFRILSKTGKKIGLFKKFNWVLYKLAREHDYEKANPNMRETMKNLIYKDLTPLLSKIKTPTLIIWGENDKITPVSDAKKMKTEVKNSKLFSIKGAGHSPFYTHPRQVLNILLKEL